MRPRFSASRVLLAVCWIAGSALPCSAEGKFHPDDVRIDRGVRQLFFDSQVLASTEGLVRNLHFPVKFTANPVLKREHPWEGFRVQVYGTVLFDPAEKLFKAWYMNIPRTAKEKVTVNGRSRPGHATLLSYATSQDGIEWKKPILGLVDFEGSTDNNMIAPDLYNPEGFSVLHEPEDANSERRYKALYWDHGLGPTLLYEGLEIYGEGERDGMHVAFSPDGVHWTPYEGNPIRKEGSDTGQVVLFDPGLGKYVAFGRFGAGGRKVARMESEDFIHWSDPELVLEPDELDGPNTQFYGISIDLYEGIYVGTLWMFRIEEGSIGRIDFQLCHSRDGKHWVRDPERRVYIPNGPPGAWDHGDMRGACRSTILNDRILFYYAGSAADHGKGGEQRIGMDIGFAVLRRDGWYSLDAATATGTLLTRPFTHPGGELHLNLGANRGTVVAEFLDAEGSPFYPEVRSHPVSTDSLDASVVLQNLGPRSLEGRLVTLRIKLQNAALYSFWFE